MADNKLYFGDNLAVLREHVKDESVDLVYLDPPFNSKANYNVLYKEVDGTPSAAQIRAFSDFWEWDEVTARTYHELLTDTRAPADLVNLLKGFDQFLGHNAMLAYLVMMAPRLVELHRVLKPTGSIYLHCDPTASHYLKVLLDAVFGVRNHRNEIVWKRTTVHSDSQRWSAVNDVLLFYTRSDAFTWNSPRAPHSREYVEDKYRHSDLDGRRYMLDNMTSPNPRPNMMYEWKGHQSPPYGWRYSRETMAKLDAEGRIWYPDSKAKRPRIKKYLDENPGRILDTSWTDIPPINSQASERMGFPTQKPLTLLDRVISASSNEGDVVLDPFCGCGTTIAAAQKLGRKWIGIDVTYLAVNLMENRLADMFGDKAEYEVHGIPTDWHSAVKLAEETDTPRKEFELWALSLVKARPKGDPSKKGGGDKGIDGVRFFMDGSPPKPQTVIVSVKSDKKPVPAYVRDLRGTMEREGAAIGALILLHAPSERSSIASESAGSGFYRSEVMGRDYPKLQVLTVEGLLKGNERLEMPQLGADELTHKKAKKEHKKTKQGKLDV